MTSFATTPPFFVPNIAGRAYAPGPQPYSPGNSHYPWMGNAVGLSASAQPAPTPVGVINLLIGNPGLARIRANPPVVNQYAVLPSDYFYIRGFVGKSQG
jgi:hypothetical protein